MSAHALAIATARVSISVNVLTHALGYHFWWVVRGDLLYGFMYHVYVCALYALCAQFAHNV